MTWDTTLPLGSEAKSNGDNRIRELKTDIGTALTAEGSFPGADTANPKFRWTPSRGDTASRPASPVSGQLYINTQTLGVERYNGSSWDFLETMPTDNTVSTAKIVNASVTTAKLADDSVTPAKVSGWDGWLPAHETWTYASATTFTVSGDVTAKYNVGDKIKLTQTSAKYFYVIAISYGAPNTTVTVFGGTDYTLANAAITLPYYSKFSSPNAFPSGFAYTPASITGWSSTTTSYHRLTIEGRTATVRFIVDGTSNATTVSWTMPVTSANFSTLEACSQLRSVDNTASINDSIAQVLQNSSTLTCFLSGAVSAWTGSGSKSVRGYISFEI